MFKEFKAFVMRGNVLDLAVGIVIGAAFTGVVQSVVNGLINPLVAIVGDSSLEQLSFSIGTKTVGGETVPNSFAYGAVLNGALNFLIVAAVVFFLVVKPVNALVARQKRGEETPEPTTRSCPECLTEIPKKARRCSACTAEVGAAA
ncbi:MAG TPA: large conductance mechanosensitive channel protein MscL [Actinomycetota bacterium]